MTPTESLHFRNNVVASVVEACDRFDMDFSLTILTLVKQALAENLRHRGDGLGMSMVDLHAFCTAQVYSIKMESSK